MPDYEQELVESLTRVVKRACDASPDARSIVRTIGLWLTHLSDNQSSSSARSNDAIEPESDIAAIVPVAAPPDTAPLPLGQRTDPETFPVPENITSALIETVSLRIGDAHQQIAVVGSADEIQAARRAAEAIEAPGPVPRAPLLAGRDRPDLALIARRCRIKANACRAICDAQHGRSGGMADLARVRQQAVSIPDCDLWMDEADANPESASLEVLALCFDNVAAIAEGLHVAIEKQADRPRQEDLMHLLAEAQSAMRQAVARSGMLTSDDLDQDLAFRWLRIVTEEERVFIRRYMRDSDRAEPANHGDLAARISVACETFTKVVERERESDKLRKKIEYHAKRINKAGESGGAESDWQTISRTVERLAEIEPPTSAPLREILLPIMDLLPDDLEVSQALDIALDSAEKYRTRDRGASQPPIRSTSPEILRVREALRGKRLVIVGGEEREYSRSRIAATFELAECEWATTTEHGPSQPLVNAVERIGTDLVLVLIRLTGHQQVDDVTTACRQRDIPLVRVPAGYGVHQIAQQIIEQQSQRLGIA